MEETAQAFIDKYDKYIYEDEEFQIENLDPKDFIEACRVSSNSAAGIDGWAPRDLALLSDKALILIVDMIQKIEDGAPWPETMTKARAVFLSKDPNDTTNRLA